MLDNRIIVKITANKITGYFDLVCKKVHEQMRKYTNNQLEVEVVLFEFNGCVIGRYAK